MEMIGSTRVGVIMLPFSFDCSPRKIGKRGRNSNDEKGRANMA
jgi:hypothetical protein